MVAANVTVKKDVELPMDTEKDELGIDREDAMEPKLAITNDLPSEILEHANYITSPANSPLMSSSVNSISNSKSHSTAMSNDSQSKVPHFVEENFTFSTVVSKKENDSNTDVSAAKTDFALREGLDSSPDDSKRLQNDSYTRWDWNTLSSLHATPLIKEGDYNIIKLSIDGETKNIKYDPKFNKLLEEMDFFLNFNLNSFTKDSLFYAKKRLKSYCNFLKQYLEETGKKSNEIADTGLDAKPSVNFGSCPQINSLIQLWSYQTETYFTQGNSLLFAPEATQKLLDRKSMRNELSTTSNQSIPHYKQTTTETDSQSSNSKMQGPLHEIDVLLLRPINAKKIGWQLAYNEPNISVADYPLRISPWKQFDEQSYEQLCQFLDSDRKSYKYDSETVVTTDLGSLKYFDNNNALEYLLDCMGRKLSDHKPYPQKDFEDEINSETKSEHFMNTPRDLNDAFSVESFTEPSSVTTIKKKKREAKSKKSGFVNFFRRKHPYLSQSNNQTSTHSTPPRTSSPKFTPFASGEVPYVSPNLDLDENTNAEPIKPDENEIQNVWLEDYFCDILNNYKKISMPTQFYFPKSKPANSELDNSGNYQIKIPQQSSQESVNSEEQAAPILSANKSNYGRELLQLKLPFHTDSIPAILCPWIWITLTRTRWGNLLREMKRCLEPEGYALALVTDLRVSNSKYDNMRDAEPEFKTSVERNTAYDDLSIQAMNSGLHIYPTKHLARKFRECGFVNIKTTTLSLKSGDLKSNMGCINELMIALLYQFIMKAQINRTNAENGLEVNSLIERYIDEHWDGVDDGAGCLRVLFVVAQKPKSATKN